MPENAPSAKQEEGTTVAQPELRTERLYLRQFRLEDADTVQTLLQCREIAANTRSIDHPYQPGSAKLWIERLFTSWETGESAVFAICFPDERVVGAIGLEIKPEDENAEIGFWIGQPYWGKGICSEAAAAVVQFGFKVLGLNKIFAHHLSRNPASGRVMQKIGMRKEGYFEGHTKKWGVFEDIVVYGLLAKNASDAGTNL